MFYVHDHIHLKRKILLQTWIRPVHRDNELVSNIVLNSLLVLYVNVSYKIVSPRDYTRFFYFFKRVYSRAAILDFNT